MQLNLNKIKNIIESWVMIIKVAFICPSNMLYMPYVNNYIEFFDSLDVDYTVINWDRFNLEENNNEFIYRDKKHGHQRNYYDYFKYKKFILDKLEKTRYDKIIIFTLQLGYFLKRYLINNYKGKYIFDIRDYNKIYKFTNFRKFIDFSYMTVISSAGYKSWLPNSDKYIVNHNTSVKDMESIGKSLVIQNKYPINISNIGVIRDWDVNIGFINKLKNLQEFNLIFHGEGTINQKLKEYVVERKIDNVEIYGRYVKEEEKSFYENTDIINVLRYNYGINNKTALPNRLYNAAVYGKPMLALEGTYLAEQIKLYNLGLVVESFEDLDIKIKEYLNGLDINYYKLGREKFLNKVIEENNKFKGKLEGFIYK